MPTVRKRRSRKNARINSTRYGRRLKKRSNKSITSKIRFACIREKWDSKKTMKQNLMDLGLSYDPNKAVPVVKRREEIVAEGKEQTQQSDPQTLPMQTDLITELEAIAADAPPSKPFLMSPSEARFIAHLITHHDTNYKKMVRDKKNYNQWTEGQLKKKCLHFHKSPYVYLLDSDD